MDSEEGSVNDSSQPGLGMGHVKIFTRRPRESISVFSFSDEVEVWRSQKSLSSDGGIDLERTFLCSD